MKISLLALESGADSTSVCLLRKHDAAEPFLITKMRNGRQHAEHMLHLIDGALQEAGISKGDLRAIAFGQGPGAFTGLRTACAAAQGLALGLDLPIIAVDTLTAAAYANIPLRQDGQLIVSLLDARMNECYVAVYDQPPGAGCSSLQTLQKPCLIPAQQVMPWLSQHFSGQKLLFCGNALSVFSDLCTPQEGVTVGTKDWPDAGTVAQIALTKWQAADILDCRHAAPIYIRDKVAFTESERQSGAGGNPAADIPVHNEPVLAPQADPLIRPMRQKDLDAVVSIESRIEQTPWSRKHFEDSLAQGYYAVVLETPPAAQSSPSIAGYAVQMLAPDAAHLLIIGVDQPHQGNGFGKRLLAHLEHHAALCNLPAQLLEVRASNEQALNLYQKVGYTRIGLRKGYYRGVNGGSEDAVVLQKSLQ